MMRSPCRPSYYYYYYYYYCYYYYGACEESRVEL